MHFVIMGCGRVGALLAKTLDSRGHTVAVIDQDPDSFLKLGPDFAGSTITGVGFDREVLKRARVSEAYAFAAVASGDNSNILSARVARETFGVKNIAARIYDPKRAQIFERLGVPTVATVRWTAEQMMRRLIPQGSVNEYRDPSGQIGLSEVHVNPAWVSHPIADVEYAVPGRVGFITRAGEGILPRTDTLIQEGDLLHIMCRLDDLDDIERILDAPPADRYNPQD